MENVKFHKHTGVDSPRIKGKDVDDLILDDEVMHTENTETVEGVKTLSSIPILPASDPTADNELARKKYVDDSVVASNIQVSTDLIDSADTERAIQSERDTYEKDKDITFNEVDGTITIKFDLKDDNGSGGCYGRLYKNGGAVGTEQQETAGGWVTYSEDIALVTGDEIQLYTKYDDAGGGVGGLCRNFRLYYTKALTPTAGTINLN